MNIDNTINNIGKKIKYYRNLNNLSLSKLAKDANISKSTLFGLEEGRSNPTITTLINIAQTLNIKVSELIGLGQESREDCLNLTLINHDEDSSTSIYKLSLLANQYYELKQTLYSSIEAEVISGAILNLDTQTIINSGKKTVLKSTSSIKALQDGAIVILTIKEHINSYYFKSDIFFEKPSSEILAPLIKNHNTAITRVVFNSMYPIEELDKSENIQTVENISNREVHYYIYSTFKGFIGGVNQLVKSLNLNVDEKLKESLEFIHKINTSKELTLNDYKNITNNPIIQIENLLIQAIKNSYKDVKLLTNSQELNSEICQNSTYILIIDELIKSIESMQMARELTISIMLYRAIELLIPLKEQELSPQDLKLYLTIRETLPQAYYYAILGESKLAIRAVEYLLKNINLNETSLDSGISLYLEIINILKLLIEKNSNYITLNSKTNLENKIADLNLEIVKKENIHPSIKENGKFIYLLKVAN